MQIECRTRLRGARGPFSVNAIIICANQLSILAPPQTPPPPPPPPPRYATDVEMRIRMNSSGSRPPAVVSYLLQSSRTRVQSRLVRVRSSHALYSRLRDSRTRASSCVWAVRICSTAFQILSNATLNRNY